MTKLTRRALLGAAATGSMTLAACATSTTSSPATFDGTAAFLHGIASGDPLSDRVVIWTRITPAGADTGPISVNWQISAAASPGAPVRSGTFRTSAARDWTVKIDVSGLTPATEYTYQFKALTADGEIASPIGRTRTTAASGDAPVKLGVVSCSNWQFGRFNAYRALADNTDLDAIVHLGDYLYEYGIDGYGGDVARSIGREHEPTTEIITLADYRARHAQYKTDPDLQAAHAAAPWICTWDDHESTNDSYRTGAQNHNPENGEGDWTARKQAALQAYFEWMPLRDPAPGKPRAAAYRSFHFGDVASLHALETRLTGRSESFGWFEVLDGATTPDETQERAVAAMTRANDPARTMLGAQQEDWLAAELASSKTAGRTWQVLANQVIMARTKLPNLQAGLTEAQRNRQTNSFVQQMIAFSAMGLPMNLDAWDGYPAARDRLYESAKAANARLVTLTGDTHTAWANTLVDRQGERRGVEFGCTSISSPGTGAYIVDVPDLGERIAAANPEVDYHDPFGNGYTRVTLTRDSVSADFVKVSSILDETFETSAVSFRASATASGLSSLAKA